MTCSQAVRSIGARRPARGREAGLCCSQRIVRVRAVRRERRHRWSGLPWAVGLSCVLTVWLVAPAGAAGPRKPVAMAAEATAKTLTNCTFAALQKAVAAGGVAHFACSGTIAFTQAVTVGAGNSVTLDGSGWSVVFDGKAKTRLFVVAKGGTLTLVDLTLQDGAVTGAKGASGAKGSKGSNGDNGASGAGRGGRGVLGTGRHRGPSRASRAGTGRTGRTVAPPPTALTARAAPSTCPQAQSSRSPATPSRPTPPPVGPVGPVGAAARGQRRLWRRGGEGGAGAN